LLIGDLSAVNLAAGGDSQVSVVICKWAIQGSNLSPPACKTAEAPRSLKPSDSRDLPTIPFVDLHTASRHFITSFFTKESTRPCRKSIAPEALRPSALLVGANNLRARLKPGATASSSYTL
jgi:hypothetical protein